MSPTVIRILVCCMFVSTKVSSDYVLANKYLGCYRKFWNQTSGSQPSVAQSMTVNLCIDICRQQISTFAGLQEGNQCLCGEDFSELVSENKCTRECSGNSRQYCGGTMEQSIAVYSVCSIGYFGVGCDKVCHCNQQAPCHRMTGKCPTGCDDNWIGQACDTANASPAKSEWYIGCYGDMRNPRAMEMGDPGGNALLINQTNPTNFCLGLCAQFNYTYMGTEFYHECYCGESYSRYGSSNGCTYPCSGNNSQICGGDFNISIYSVCPTGSYSINCLSQCNCMNDARCIYRNGTCPAGCEPGWTGNSCSERNCNEANGGCKDPNDVCETIDLKYATKTRCGCEEGYTKIKLWENCMDIDECLDSVASCGTDAYNCTNTVGSFVCGFCSKGYKVQNGSCIQTSSENRECSTGSTDSFSRGELIGAVIGTGIGMLVIGILIGIMMTKFRRKSRNEMQWKESQTVDATRGKSNGKPSNLTAFEDYEGLDKTQEGIEQPYAQLKDSTVNNRSSVAKTMSTKNDVELHSDNRMYDSVK